MMIWFNRKILRADEDFEDAILGTLVKDLRTPRIPLSRHRFNILDAEGRPYRYSVPVRVLVVAFLALAFLMLVVGSVLPAITFYFQGLAGLAITIINQNLASTTESVASIGTSLILGAQDNTQSVLAIIFLQIIYMLFALVIPLALIVLLIVIWVVPMTLREQILLYFVASVLSAWETTLILVVSLIAAVLQISELAQFVVNSATGNLCSALTNAIQKYFPNPEQAKCFDVVATLLPTSALYIAGTALLLLFGGVAFRLIHAAIEDRELAMRRKPPHSPGEMTGLSGFLVRRSLEAFGPSQVQTAGSVANLYALGQGAFDTTNSQQMVGASSISNPVMRNEMGQSLGSHMQTGNPLYKGSNRLSIDV